MADLVQPSGSEIASSLKEKLREKLRKNSQQRQEPTESVFSRLKLFLKGKP